MTTKSNVCEQVMARASLFLDERLSALDVAKIKSHLRSCLDCRNEYRALERLSKAAGALAATTPPSDLAKRARETITEGLFRVARSRSWAARIRRHAGRAAIVLLMATGVVFAYAAGWQRGAKETETRDTGLAPPAASSSYPDSVPLRRVPPPIRRRDSDVMLTGGARALLTDVSALDEVEAQLRPYLTTGRLAGLSDSVLFDVVEEQGAILTADGPPRSGRYRIVLEEEGEGFSYRVTVEGKRGESVSVAVTQTRMH